MKSKKLINSRRPYYRADDWTRFKMAYYGGATYAAAAIDPHPREKAAHYRQRQARAYCVNYSRRVVDTRAAYLVKEPPEVIAPQSVLDLMGNLDNRGRNFQAMLSQIIKTSCIFGTEGIMVDKPFFDVPARTRGDEQSRNECPYWSLFNPMDIMNFAHAPNSMNLAWVLLRVEATEGVLDLDHAAVKTGTSPTAFMLWTPEAIFRFDKKGEPVASPQPNPLKMIPFVMARYQENLDDPDGYGISLLEDIEAVQRRIVNDYSLFDQILDDQTFSQLVVPGGLEAKRVRDEKTGEMKVVAQEVGTKEILETDVAAALPEYVSPDTAQGQLILEGLRDKKEETFNMAELKRGSAVESAAPISGLSKAYDFLDTNQSLADQAKTLECVLQRALWFTGLWIGETAPIDEYSVIFPTDFGIETSGELATEYAQINSGMNPQSPTLNTKYLQRIDQIRFPTNDPQEAARDQGMIKAEISGDHTDRQPPVE